MIAAECGGALKYRIQFLIDIRISSISLDVERFLQMEILSKDYIHISTLEISIYRNPSTILVL